MHRLFLCPQVKKAQRKAEMTQPSGESEGKSLDENKSESDEGSLSGYRNYDLGTMESDAEDVDQENEDKSSNPIAKLYNMQHAYFTSQF